MLGDRQVQKGLLYCPFLSLFEKFYDKKWILKICLYTYTLKKMFLYQLLPFHKHLCLHFGFKHVAMAMDLALRKIESPLNFHVLNIHYKHTNSRIFSELNDRRVFTLGITWERLTFRKHMILFLQQQMNSCKQSVVVSKSCYASIVICKA